MFKNNNGHWYTNTWILMNFEWCANGKMDGNRGHFDGFPLMTRALPVTFDQETWAPVLIVILPRKLAQVRFVTSPYFTETKLLFTESWLTFRKIRIYLSESYTLLSGIISLVSWKCYLTCRKVDVGNEHVGKLSVSCRNVISYFRWSWNYFPWSKKTESWPTYRKVELTDR